MKKTVVVIPARFQSLRLPGKPLLMLGDKSIIERVYGQAQQAELVDEVIIATDDQKIFDHVKSFGGQVMMTDVAHKSGTDRIAELAHNNSDWGVVVNVQGDEPFINPEDINRAIEPFRYDATITMTSLYHDLYDWQDIKNPNNVKVVLDINDEALYFSRSVIPYVRDLKDLVVGEVAVHRESLSEDEFMSLYLRELNAEAKSSPFKKHIGLYAYKRDVLLAISNLNTTELESLEKLEQLRALENGIKIKMIKTSSIPIGIDTQEDFEKAQKLIQQSLSAT